tara:strand:+ start:5314 stop:5820 length:507 start_codon:yes stop_codon:yes gene_type:complete
MPQGEIANPAMLDQPDTPDVWKIGSTLFPPTPIGSSLLILGGNPATSGGRGISTTNGTGKTLADGTPSPSIAPMMIIDETVPYAPVPGTNPVFPFIPTPATVDRTASVPTVNTRVYFGDGLGGHRRVVVSGDQLTTTPATIPPLRRIDSNPLTVGTLYPTILIGTRTV